MRKIYKLGNKYFNIANLKSVSEIHITDEFELHKETEIQKIFKNLTNPKSIYKKGSKSIYIYIDDRQYLAKNYELVGLLVYEPTAKKEAEFEEFKKEAEQLLSAFKMLVFCEDK